jgi:phosphoglycerol transferase MdoB-like AlkP superfamily enzyme
VYGNEIVPIDRFHIPGLIVGGSIASDSFEPVASQIDLAPTLLSLIGITAEHPMIGHDLTKSAARTAAGRAIMQFHATQAYMEGDQVAILQKDLPVRQFTFQDGRLSPAETTSKELATKALAHASWSSLAYEKSLYRLSTGKGA